MNAGRIRSISALFGCAAVAALVGAGSLPVAGRSNVASRSMAVAATSAARTSAFRTDGVASPDLEAAVRLCMTGECMPMGDLPGWRQVFVDDFALTLPAGQFPEAVSSRWGAYLDGWKDTSKKGTYMPSKVLSTHDGVLDIHVRTENGQHLVSAPWPKVPEATGSAGGHVVGRYAIRFKADRLPGYKFVSLLWPDSGGNLLHGEIDFPEGDLDDGIYAYTHRANAAHASDQDWFDASADWSTWHTAVIERTSSSVRYLLDGRVIGESTSRLPTGPMGWVLQAETSLVSETPASSNGHILIDWVAVYLPTVAPRTNAS